MSGWVLSVTAVVCLTVLLDIIMPDGQMKKYVKGIVSIIVIFVIVTPLASLAGKQPRFTACGATEGMRRAVEDFVG